MNILLPNPHTIPGRHVLKGSGRYDHFSLISSSFISAFHEPVSSVGSILVPFRIGESRTTFSCPQSLYGSFKSYVRTGIGMIIRLLDSEDLRWSDTYTEDVVCQSFAKVSFK